MLCRNWINLISVAAQSIIIVSNEGGSKMEQKPSYIFIILGLFSILLALLDFLIEGDIWGGFLALAWGFLFLFFSQKNYLLKVYGNKITKLLQTIVIIFVVVTGLLKFFIKIYT